MAVNNLKPHEIKDLISRYEAELRKLEFQIDRTKRTINELEQSMPQAEKRYEEERRARLNGDSEAEEPEAAPSASSETASPQETAAAGEAAQGSDGEQAEAKPRRRGRRSTKAAQTADAGAASEEQPAAPETTEEKPRRRGRPKGTTTKAKTTAKGKGGRKKASKDRSSGYRLSKYDELILQALDERGKVLITTELQDFVEQQMQREGQPVDAEEVRLRISRSLQKLVNRREDLKKVTYEGRGFAYGRQNWFNKEGELKSKYSR